MVARLFTFDKWSIFSPSQRAITLSRTQAREDYLRQGLPLPEWFREISGLTGVDDPYEPPLRAEITLDTVVTAPEENARTIFDYLVSRGFVRAGDNPAGARPVRLAIRRRIG